MATIKSFTDLSQSKKLAEILLLESADMAYWKKSYQPNDYAIMAHHTKELQEGFEARGIEYIPAWSLAALLSVLPEKYTELIKEGGMYRIIIKDSYMTSLFENPVDACVVMIECLNESNLLRL